MTASGWRPRTRSFSRSLLEFADASRPCGGGVRRSTDHASNERSRSACVPRLSSDQCCDLHEACTAAFHGTPEPRIIHRSFVPLHRTAGRLRSVPGDCHSAASRCPSSHAWPTLSWCSVENCSPHLGVVSSDRSWSGALPLGTVAGGLQRYAARRNCLQPESSKSFENGAILCVQSDS